MFVFAGLIGLFPKHLPKKNQKAVEHEVDGERCEQMAEIADKHDDKDVTLKSKYNKKFKPPNTSDRITNSSSIDWMTKLMCFDDQPEEMHMSSCLLLFDEFSCL